MKIKIIKRIICIAILILVVGISVNHTSNILEEKESLNRYAAFFSEKQDIDVFLLGSSHMRHGILPMELWGEYGISSYNLAADGDTIAVSYWTLVNALDYKKTSVVVLDVYDFVPGYKHNPSWRQVHQQFDAFPASKNKVKTILDLFDDREELDENGDSIFSKRWELLCKLIGYHSRWNELEEEDFYTKKQFVDLSKVWRGASCYTGLTKRNEKTYLEDDSEIEYDYVSRNYLIKIIELCKESNIELILINTGYDSNDEAKKFHDSVYDIAKDYGLKYIDFTKFNLIDFNTDLASTEHNTHVNFSGAIKITNYIGKELSRLPQIENHCNDYRYQQWNDDYELYCDAKYKMLMAAKDIYSYLGLLCDDDYIVTVEIYDKELFDDCIFVDLMQYINIETTELKEDNKIDENCRIKITVLSKRNGKNIDNRVF